MKVHCFLSVPASRMETFLQVVSRNCQSGMEWLPFINGLQKDNHGGDSSQDHARCSPFD